MENTNLTDQKRLEIKRITEPDDEIVSLLETAVQGTEGGMRHSLRDVRKRVEAYGKAISFLTLYKKGSLMGVVGLCRRKTWNAGEFIDSVYVRYLAVQSAFQAVQAPDRKGRVQAGGDEGLKARLFRMFRENADAGDARKHLQTPEITYAFVESKNERSKNIVHQAGLEYIRSFLTVAFSRISPRLSSDVTRLDPSEETRMRELLSEFYSGYCFYTDEFAFLDGKYYVMKKEGEIVAGVSAIPARFRLDNVPGVWGWIIMKILPKTPWLRRLINPGEFRYLVLGSIYCRRGHEESLPDLFSSVCADQGYYTALTWLDDHSDLYESLRTNSRMGLLNRMLNAKPGLVYASFTNVSGETKERFYESPAYISGYDFS